MGRLAWVLIVITGLLLIITAGFGGYTFGDYEGYHRGYEQGYRIGCIEGAGSGYTLRDPTYSELMDFLEEDTTDKNEYVEGSYTCVDFVGDLNNNAENEGFRAAYVYIEYPGVRAHAVAAFETVDEGLVYIEPQYDDEVEVRPGISYSEENGYKEPDSDDTIDRVVIVW